MENIEQKKPIVFSKLYNTTDEDFSFQWDSATYTVKAGESKEFINFIAEHGAKKMADKYAKTANSDERKVLQQAFLQNMPVAEMARTMGIDLTKIRQEVLTKEKEKSRVINLESQVQSLNEKLNKLLESQEKKEEVKLDKRSKEYRDSLKESEAQEATETK
jgi:tRNA uridine 5-carbamoylmethylation protein Kti12